ncbi:MAG: hypothetical protein Q9222_001857 [Ikaeria aurantiellina]
MTSPMKPRLINISPRTPSSKRRSSQTAGNSPEENHRALVSAFSPDTPPETPDVANWSEANDDPTSLYDNKGGLDRFHAKIRYPITPPSSRIPTPFEDIFSPAGRRKRSPWPSPTMTHLDSLSTWILQELELAMTDFPATSLRLRSPVIQRIRSANPGSLASGTSTRDRSATGPHSRYSPYNPLPGHLAKPQCSSDEDRAPHLHGNYHIPELDVTAIALRSVFPDARRPQLDSLQATYLALQYVLILPSSGLAAASATDTATLPSTSRAKHSRSSSIVSTVPAKARAMLGLEAPARSPVLFSPPVSSWFRASSPELDPETKSRLENVKLLLETSVRKILVEVQGKPLVKEDEALVRAVGQIVKLGEKGKRDAWTTMM